MLVPGALNSCLDMQLSVGGNGYYNALYKYLIMYAVDVLLSCIYKYHHVFRVGHTARSNQMFV